MKPQAVAAVLLRVKKDSQCIEIDCNRVDAELIKPGLEAVMLEVFHVEEETCVGNILNAPLGRWR